MARNVRNLLRKLGGAIEKHSLFQVEIIHIDGSIDAGDDLYWGMVQLEDGQTLARVRAARAKMFPGAKYQAKLSPVDGVLEVVGPDPVTTAEFFDGLPDPLAAMSVTNHAWTHRGVKGLDPLWVEPQQVLGGQVRPMTTNSLYVYVTPCPPLNFAGNSVDLSAYLPSAGLEQIAIISIDYTTRALAVTTGGAIAISGGGYPWQGSGSVPFDMADVEAVTVDNNHIRLAAVRLYATQTEVKWSDIFMGLRDFAGRRTGYVRLDDDDPTIDGLIEKITGGTGVAISRTSGDSLVISATGSAAGWDVDAVPDDASALDDEFDDGSFDTGLWTEYDPGSKQTVAEAGTTLTLSQGSQSDPYLTGIYQAIPAGDFTLATKMKLSHTTTAAGLLQAGFALWVDPTDSSEDADLDGPGDGPIFNPGVYRTYFTAYDTVGWFLSDDATFTADTWYYLRLRRNGASYYFAVSTDGENWTNYNFTPVNTPAYFGLGIVNDGTSVTFEAEFEFFRYRNVFDSATEPVHGAGDEYVRAAGDDMTGTLAIAVATATDNALTVQSTDDDLTNALLIVWDSAGNDQITLAGDGAAVFNEEGNAADFRVESANNTAMVYVDGSNDRVGIANAAPLATLDVVGSLRVGDSDTNYLGISTDGTLTLVGNATTWDDLRVPLTQAKPGLTKAPGFEKVLDNGAASTGVYAYHFDKNAEEELFLIVQMPHTWREGSDIEPHVHWSPTDTDTGSVVWGLEYSWQNINAVFGNSTIETVVDAANGTALTHQYASFGTISGGGKTASSILMCRVFREAANGADDYDNDAIGLDIDFHYEINSLGASTAP